MGNHWTSKWRLQPVRRCCKGSQPARVAPALKKMEMQLTKQKFKQMVKEELTSVLRARVLEGRKNLNPKRLSDEERALVDAAARDANVQPGDAKRVSGIKDLRRGSTLIAVNKDGVARAFVYNPENVKRSNEYAASGTGQQPEPEPAEAPQDTPTKVEDIPEEDIEAAKKLRMNPIEYVLLRSQAELGDKNAIQALSTRPRPEKHPFKEKKPGFFSKLKGMFKEELEKELVKKLKRGK